MELDQSLQELVGAATLLSDKELEQHSKQQLRRIRALAKDNEYVATRMASNLSFQLVSTLQRNFVAAPVKTRLTPLSLSSGMPVHFLSAMFDPANLEQLKNENDGVKVYLRNVLAGICVDGSLVGIGALVEFAYDALSHYCEACGFNSLPQAMQKWLWDHEVLYCWACEHPQLLSGILGGTFGFALQCFLDWWKGGRIRWTDNLLTSALKATLAAIVAPFTTSWMGAMVGVVICCLVASFVDRQVFIAKRTGESFFQQMFSALKELPSFLLDIVRPVPTRLPGARFDTGTDDIPQDLACTITNGLLYDPVVLRGRFYERREITAWLQMRGTCPYTRAPAGVNDLKDSPRMRCISHEYARIRGYPVVSE
jgi:hypothetical protein